MKRATIQELSDEDVLEVSRAVFSSLLGITDEIDAQEKVFSLLKHDETELSKFRENLKKSATSYTSDTIDFLRFCLEDLHNTGSGEALEQAIDDTGNRQTVLGIDLLILGGLSSILYIAFLRGGTLQDEEIITHKTNSDGSEEITVNKKTTYLNPLNPLSGMLANILGK